jgi:hypothetical protein
MISPIRAMRISRERVRTFTGGRKTAKLLAAQAFETSHKLELMDAA